MNQRLARHTAEGFPLRRLFVAPALGLLAFLSVADAGPRPGPQPLVDPFVDGTFRSGPEVIAIPEQTFIMGSRTTDPGYRPSELRHRVTVSAFAIGRTEVTTAQFCEFLNDRGNQTEHGIKWVLTDRTETCPIVESSPGRFTPKEGFADRPVVTISWAAARAYCDWLSEKTGHRYRLPTEAEWECAARAGTETTWPWGNEFDHARVRAGATSTVAVASLPANDWGLHDMLGNVWEWVMDCHEDDFYSHSPGRDPVAFESECWTPGIRGGSFADGPDYCRPGYRINTWWWGEYAGVGMRVVREGDFHIPSPRARRPSERRRVP